MGTEFKKQLIEGKRLAELAMEAKFIDSDEDSDHNYYHSPETLLKIVNRVLKCVRHRPLKWEKGIRTCLHDCVRCHLEKEIESILE